MRCRAHLPFYFGALLRAAHWPLPSLGLLAPAQTFFGRVVIFASVSRLKSASTTVESIDIILPLDAYKPDKKAETTAKQCRPKYAEWPANSCRRDEDIAVASADARATSLPYIWRRQGDSSTSLSPMPPTICERPMRVGAGE